MTWAISFGISFMGHTQYITFTAYGWQFLDFSGEVLQNYRNCLIISLSRALYSLAKKEKKEHFTVLHVIIAGHMTKITPHPNDSYPVNYYFLINTVTF